MLSIFKMANLKSLLLGLLCLLSLIWLFLILATALPDWSKGSIGLYGAKYGLWDDCFEELVVVSNSESYTHWKCYDTDKQLSNTGDKSCEGAVYSTRAFSILSILFTSFIICLVLVLIAMPQKATKSLFMALICLSALNILWLFLSWVMWAAYTNDRCSFGPKLSSYTSLGASWFLTLFAFIFFLYAFCLVLHIFKLWQKMKKENLQYTLGPQSHNVPAHYPAHTQNYYPQGGKGAASPYTPGHTPATPPPHY